MSSRNRRLNAEERERAPLLYETLQAIQSQLQPGPTQPLFNRHRQQLAEAGFRIDYLTLANATDLSEITNWNGTEKAVILLAAFNGDVRLIDNLQIK